MQIQNSSKVYRSMLDCAKYVYRNEGLSAFYISYPTTLSMTVPFTALQFLAYESISTAMNPTKHYDPFTHCTAGAVAGGFAAALTTPMDVIKTMLQTRGTAADAELRSVNSFAAGCRVMYRREGLRGFFKGVRPRVVTTMPSTAICWTAYEASKYVVHPDLNTRHAFTNNLPGRTSFDPTHLDLDTKSGSSGLCQCNGFQCSSTKCAVSARLGVLELPTPTLLFKAEMHQTESEGGNVLALPHLPPTF